MWLAVVAVVKAYVNVVLVDVIENGSSVDRYVVAEIARQALEVCCADIELMMVMRLYDTVAADALLVLVLVHVVAYT